MAAASVVPVRHDLELLHQPLQLYAKHAICPLQPPFRSALLPMLSLSTPCVHTIYGAGDCMFNQHYHSDNAYSNHCHAHPCQNQDALGHMSVRPYLCCNSGFTVKSVGSGLKGPQGTLP